MALLTRDQIEHHARLAAIACAGESDCPYKTGTPARGIWLDAYRRQNEEENERADQAYEGYADTRY